MSNTLVPLVEGSVDELHPLLTTMLLTTVLDFRVPGFSVTALLLSPTPRWYVHFFSEPDPCAILVPKKGN